MAEKHPNSLDTAKTGGSKQPASRPGIKTILTAEVRYDKRLSSTAKIILSEIIGLAKKHKKCWATNAYFAQKFGVDPKTISRSITCLAKLGYIRVEISQQEGNKRNIFLCEDAPEMSRPMDKNDNTSGQNTPEGAASLLIYTKNNKSKDEREGNAPSNFYAKGLQGLTGASQKPTWQEVELYMQTLGLGWLKGNEKHEAMAFVDYYAATGWQMKSGPMQDWQAATRNWLNKSLTLSQNSNNSKMTAIRSIKDITDTWASLPTTAPIEAKPTPVSYSIAPPRTTGNILAYFLYKLQSITWPQEIREKLIQLNWHREILEMVAAYAANDVAKMLELGINPAKGFLVLGPVGCGKTELISMLKEFVKPGLKCERIFYLIDECCIKGEAALDPLYSPKHTTSGKPIEYLFDDIGIDQPINYFGRIIFIGQKLIYGRHLLFKKNGAKSHFTSNLNIDELAEHYQEISRSRLREMCNVIQFPGDAPDLRF